MQQHPATPGPFDELSPLRESIWHAPMLTTALVYTSGVVLDRLVEIPPGFCLLLGGIALSAFVLMRLIGNERLAPVYLVVVGISFGSAYHGLRQRLYPTDDIGYFVSDTPQPVRLRGRLVEEPHYRSAGPADPLRTLARSSSATTLLRVSVWINAPCRDWFAWWSRGRSLCWRECIRATRSRHAVG